MGILLSTDVESAKKLAQAKPYLHRCSAEMVPDVGFVKQLKKLRPTYEVVWDGISKKWQIWDFPKEEGKDPFCITVVQTAGKTYRELGADVLLRLQEGDTTRFTLAELVAYFDELDNQVQRRKRKDFLNKIDSIARDTFSFAQGILAVQVPQTYKIARNVLCET